MQRAPDDSPGLAATNPHLKKAIRNTYPAEIATGSPPLGKRELDRQGRIEALRPVVAACDVLPHTARWIAARLGKGNGYDVAHQLLAAKRHGFLKHHMGDFRQTFWSRTPAGERWLRT